MRKQFRLRIIIATCVVIVNSIFVSGGGTRAQSKESTIALPEYKKVGDGPKTLLLIPCASCRWDEWEQFMERNKSRYTMFAITPPGHGGTPVPNLRKNSSQAIWHDNLVRAISQFIDDQSLNNVILVGHSWGSSIAVELATARPERFAMLINLDGGIENSSWRPNGSKQRLDAANKVVETWGKNFEDAEQWRQFNRISPPAGEMITRSDAILWMKLYGSIMATSKDVVLQYWRENFLVDLTEKTRSLRIPILDIKCLNGANQEASRQAHIDNLTNAGIASKVKTVFLYDTSHFVMLHRPNELDQLIRDFVEGRNVADLRNP